MSRPSDVETFMRMAEVAAERSLCSRARVGAVIVSRDQVVVSTGRNGPPRGFDHREEPCTEWCTRAMQDSECREPDYTDCPSLHAEVNALLTSDRSARTNGTIYVTGELCYQCAKMIANSGISRVVVLKNDADHRARNSKFGYVLLHNLGINVVRYERT